MLSDSLFNQYYPAKQERTIKEKQEKIRLLKDQVQRLEEAIEFQRGEERLLKAAQKACLKLESFRKSRVQA